MTSSFRSVFNLAFHFFHTLLFILLLLLGKLFIFLIFSSSGHNSDVPTEMSTITMSPNFLADNPFLSLQNTLKLDLNTFGGILHGRIEIVRPHKCTFSGTKQRSYSRSNIAGSVSSCIFNACRMSSAFIPRCKRVVPYQGSACHYYPSGFPSTLWKCIPK